MFTELPGFQRARPPLQDSERTVRGLPLRFGRFLEFAHLMFLFRFCLDKDPERDQHLVEAFHEVEEEWRQLGELTRSNDEELLILLFKVLETYADLAPRFDNVCLNEEVNSAARFDRSQFERKFVSEIVPPEDALPEIVALSKQQDSFD